MSKLRTIIAAALLLLPVLNPVAAQAAIAHVASVSTGSGGGATAVTSSAINTTGANLLVVVTSVYSNLTLTVSDSKGNAYTALTYRSQAANPSVRIYYCASPTVGTGHTFSVTASGSYPTISASAFSGAAASPFDQESGSASGSASTSHQPGSITPSANGCLLVTGVCTNTGSHTVNGSFSATTTNQVGATCMGGGIAYKIQTTAAAENPTWTYSSSSTKAAAMAVFKPADIPVLPKINPAVLNQILSQRIPRRWTCELSLAP